MADNTTLPGTGDTIAADDIAGVKHQRVKVEFGADGSAADVSATNPMPTASYDKAGNGIDSLSGGTGHTGLLVATGGTDYIVSANNSSAAQLAAGATFTGVIETIFNEPDISLLLTCDQPGTLTVNQYIDAGGTRVVSSWPFPIAAGVPFSRSFVGNGNYFNLTFKNAGASTTTTLNINTAYGNIFPSNNLGNVPMSIGDVGGVAVAALTGIPDDATPGIPTRPIGEEIWGYSAASVLASTIDPQFMTEMAKGTGVGVSQSAGNLLITAGTSTNAEYLARSTRSWRGSWLLRYKFTASQRVANNNLAIMLADLVGATLTYNIQSATSVNVTLAAHGFTAANVGQFMCLGGVTGAAGVPGRYAIASIPDANTINFTVAGWPASGTGTLNLFGWNYIRDLYTGATATSMNFDAQRKGWASGDTVATINTTAAPGHVAQIMNDGRDIYLGDMLAASSAAVNVTSRASRVENITDDSQDLYLFIWSYNGTVAPTATTWTIGFIAVERFANMPVFVAGNRAQGTQAPMPVNGTFWQTTQPVSLAAAITANIGTTATPSIIAISSAATTNATSSKASAGTLYNLQMSNTGAAAAYVKLYNKASAPTVGTDVPIFTITVPPGGCYSQEFGLFGYRFALGIALAITNLAADSDTTAVALAQVKVIGSYV